LKIHFYEYPAIFGVLGEWFGMLNAEYNSFARKAFLVSQFPDQSAFAKLVGGVINAITLFGGNFERVYGYCNAGIIAALLFATGGDLKKMANWTGILWKLAMILAVVFHSVTFGHAARDGLTLALTGAGFTFLAYMQANLKQFHFPSFMLVGLGASLCYFSYEALGYSRFFYFNELKSTSDLADLPRVSDFPYDVLSHPMSLGALIGLCGLRMHPVFGKTFHWSFLTQLVLLALLTLVEVFQVQLPNGMDYFSTYDEFAKFHKVDGDIYAHLFTSGLAIMGVFGLVNLILMDTSSSKNKKAATVTTTNAPWVTVAMTWLVVRYTVPDDDVAFTTVPLFYLMAQLVWKMQPGYLMSILFIIAGTAAQEFAHSYFQEDTFMNSYADLTKEALLVFSLHNVWLVPFEVRAAINAMTAVLVPSYSPA
jgi:hypothetical protein